MSVRVLVSSGTGPEEVRRFVGLLARHLHAACSAAGLCVGELDCAGPAPRSASFVVNGNSARRLVALAGCHALVARSPGRGKHDRKRWFARVAVIDEPRLPSAALDPAELAFRADRASGPGGQNVNKRSSAIRVRHLPTGLSVRVAAERSQADNRRLASAHIRRALAHIRTAVAARCVAVTRLEHCRLERGRPVRTYEIDARGRLLEITA